MKLCTVSHRKAEHCPFHFFFFFYLLYIYDAMDMAYLSNCGLICSGPFHCLGREGNLSFQVGMMHL